MTTPPPTLTTAPGLIDRLLCVLATGFGTGFAPRAAGTCGSLLGPPLVWLLQADGRHPLRAVLFGIVSFLAGIVICNAGIRVLHAKDPRQVVFDEIAAFFWVFLWVPVDLATVYGMQTALAGFVLFRLLDILKPWPIRALERIPGGLGVMIDDTVAGIGAGVILAVLVRITA